MIAHEDRPQYLTVVASLTSTLLKEELLEAKKNDNEYNDIKHKGLNKKLNEIYSLSYDIIEGANEYFSQTLEKNPLDQTVPKK